MESNHADLLNALSEMQLSPAYAVRRPVLAEAERLISCLEQEVKRLNARVAWFDQENMRLIRIMQGQPAKS